MRIRVKILLMFLVLLVICAGVATYIGKSVSTKIVKDEISQRLTTNAQTRSQHIQSVLGDRKQKGEMIASVGGIYFTMTKTGLLGSLSKALEASSGDFLTGLVAPIPDTREILWLGPDGKVTSSSPTNLVGLDLSSNPLFQQGMKETCIEEDFVGPSSDFSMGTASPVIVGGKSVGVIILLGGEKPLYQITTDTTGLGKTGEVYLVNSKGYMITPSRFVENSVLNQRIDIPASSDAKMVTRKNYLGEKVLSISQPLPDVSWTMVAEISAKEAYSPISDLTNRMIWGLMVVLIIGALLAILFSKTITRPILRLRHSAEEITHGNWGHKIATSAGDEVGDLSRSFALMTTNLRKSHQELQIYSNQLEEKVQERTSELSTANDALTKEIGERKQIEGQLRRSRQELESLLNSLQAGVMIIDANSHAVVYVNPTAARMIGIAAKEEVLGRVCHCFICPAETGKCPITDLG